MSNGVLLYRVYPQGVKANLHYKGLVSNAKFADRDIEKAKHHAGLKCFENAGLNHGKYSLPELLKTNQVKEIKG